MKLKGYGRRLKRAGSIFLAAAMMVTMVPATAFADESSAIEESVQSVESSAEESATEDSTSSESTQTVETEEQTDSSATTEAGKSNSESVPEESTDSQTGETITQEESSENSDAETSKSEEEIALAELEDMAETLNSADAPYDSVKSIENGEYTITANLYVPAEYNTVLGVNAFVSNGAFPPLSPETGNAKLKVSGSGSDKTYSLTLPVNNGIFTIQTLENCINAELTDVQYEAAVCPGGKRIREITVSLKDLSGLYTFSEATCYPTILSQTWNVPLNLAIRLSEATAGVKKEQVLTANNASDTAEKLKAVGATEEEAAAYKDEVTLTVYQTTADLSEATLVATPVTAGDSRYDTLKKKFDDSRVYDWYESGFFMYDISVLDKDGNKIDIDAAKMDLQISNAAPRLKAYEAGTDWLPTCQTWSIVSSFVGYTYDNDELELLSSGKVELSDNMVNPKVLYLSEADYMGIQHMNASFEEGLKGTMTFVGLVNPEEAYNRIEKQYADGDVNAEILVTYNSGNIMTTKLPSTNFKAKSLDHTKDAEIKEATGSDGNVLAAYGLALYAPSAQGFDTNFGAVESGKSLTDYYVTLPFNDKSVSASSAKAYLILKDSESGEVTSTYLNIEAVKDGYGKVTIVKAGDSIANTTLNAELFGLSASVMDSSQFFDANSYSRYTAYIAVVNDTLPEINSGLVYNGKEQVGLPEGKAYTLEGETCGTDAGDYTAIATLKDGFTWSDGYAEKSREVNWSIAPKTLTASYTSEVIEKGGTPTYTVSVSGFTSADRNNPPEGYVAPTVSGGKLKYKGAYTLTPNGGEATNNYVFEYVSGVLYVGYEVVEYKSGNTFRQPYGTKFVSEEIVPSKKGTIVWEKKDADGNYQYYQTGGTIKEIGDYKINITMKKGYVLNAYDYKTEYSNNVYSIEPAKLTVTIDAPDSVYSDEIIDPSDISYTVSGFVNGETEETAEGWVGLQMDWIRGEAEGEEPAYAYYQPSNTTFAELVGYTNGNYCNQKALSNNYTFSDYYASKWCNIYEPTEEKDGEKVLVEDRIARDAKVIQEAEEGSSITIKMADATVMPDEYLDAMKGKNITITFTGDNFNFTMNPSKEREYVNLAGEGRYETATEIAKSAYPDGAETVILVKGTDFPDALAANAYAGVLNAPILLNGLNSLDSNVEELLTKDWKGKVKKVIILGDGMNKSVEKALEEKCGVEVTKIAGKNRFETALKIAEETVKVKSTDTVLVATGLKAADATSASSWSYANGYPILLADRTGNLKQESVDFIKNNGIEHVILLGDESVVSDSCACGLDSVRLGGINRYATSIKIAEYFASNINGSVTDHVAIAHGGDDHYPDALVGGQLAAKYNAAVILTNEKYEEPVDYIEENVAGLASEHSTFYFLGFAAKGKSGVYDQIVKAIESKDLVTE